MTSKYKLCINLVASIITVLVNISINILIMPYIVNKVGAQVYGFVSLANNIINYATIITVALNSVASRFIALNIHKGKTQDANEYFNSVFWADLFICFIILIVGSIFVIFVDKFLKIPVNLVSQVRSLFLWLLINLLLSVIGTIFTVATYITNKLYLSSIVNTIAIILKAITIIVLFGSLPMNIAFIGIGATVNSIIILTVNFVLTRSLTPELTVNFRQYSLKKTREMLNSGIWSSVTKLSQFFSDGLDTLFTNLFLDGASLGALSVAYTIPSLAGMLGSAICALFNPNLTYYYAQNDKEGIVNELKTNMKITGIFDGVLFCGIIIFGKDFFNLLIPKEDINLIYQISCITSLSLLASGITCGLTNVFVLTNRLKTNSIVWFYASIIDTIVVLLLLKYTSLGVFAVAGVSRITSIVLNTIYLPVYTSYCINIKLWTFYPIILRYLMAILICFSTFLILHSFLPNISNWIGFVKSVILCGSIGMALMFYILLNNSERRKIIENVKKFIK